MDTMYFFMFLTNAFVELLIWVFLGILIHDLGPANLIDCWEVMYLHKFLMILLLLLVLV